MPESYGPGNGVVYTRRKGEGQSGKIRGSAGGGRGIRNPCAPWGMAT